MDFKSEIQSYSGCRENMENSFSGGFDGFKKERWVHGDTERMSNYTVKKYLWKKLFIGKSYAVHS